MGKLFKRSYCIRCTCILTGKKIGLQADQILQKRVESSHEIFSLSFFFFLREFQGKVGRSSCHILITATHLVPKVYSFVLKGS